MSRVILIAAITALALIFLCSTASADVIVLKDGRKVEGIIVYKDAEKVSIKTKFGTIEFKMSEVKSIEEKKTTDQLYEEMVKKTNPRDAKQLMDLVEWCKENGLSSKASKHLKQIISLDPNHEEARNMLGYVKYQGKWVTERELKKIEEEAADKEKEAAGLVKYKGEWLPKEDVEKLQSGLVKHEDQWVTPEEKERLEKDLVEYEGEWIPREDAEKRKEGLFKVDGRWVKKAEADAMHASWETPWRLNSEHMLIITNVPYDMAQKFLAEGESAYKKAKAVFDIEPKLDLGKIIVYLAADRETYNMIGNQIGDERSSNYAVFYVEESPEAVPLSVTYFENESFTLGLVRHCVIEIFLRRLDLKESLPEWFIKGVAAYEERFFHPKYVTWSKETLIKEGGPIKLKQFFGFFGYTNREILHSGLLYSFLVSNEVPEAVKERLQEVKDAVKEGKKIESAFAKLETLLTRAEKQFFSYYEKF